MVQDWVVDLSTARDSTVSKIWKFQNCDKHISKNWIIGTYSRLWPKCLRNLQTVPIPENSSNLDSRVLSRVFTTCILKLHNWGHTNVLWCIGHVSFFVSFLSFPLAFSINSCGKWLNTIIMTTQPRQEIRPTLTNFCYIHFEILFCLLLYTVLDQLERGLLRIFKLYIQIQCQIQSVTPPSRGVINGEGRHLRQLPLLGGVKLAFKE